jgi:arginyl-tRNA--protein-N-Asp/Glu arginylyltransferase
MKKHIEANKKRLCSELINESNLSVEEIKLYQRYLELLGELNETMPRSVLDFINKSKHKKLIKEQNEITTQLAEINFWSRAVISS